MSAAPQPDSPSDPPPWTGPWADDARRLFQLFQTAAETVGTALAEESARAAAADGSPGAAGPAGSPGSADPSASAGSPGCEHPPECRYCPFCQGVSLLRRAGPEVLDQVSEFAAGLAATLRATQSEADAASAEPSGDRSAAGFAGPFDGPADGTTSAPHRPPSTVRIDVTD